ncbi:MAG: hypothetical protein SU899_04500 [Chloroflexota bacterium]|nr:hypothetical protein [Chloroflexota bacterium]
MEQLKSRKVTIAAITAAITAYIEEEGMALKVAAIQRRQSIVSSPWHTSGREEIMRMRMLWQRRIVSK